MVSIPEEYFDYADILTPYGVSIRYPNELFLEEADVEEAIKITQEMIQWVDELLK